MPTSPYGPRLAAFIHFKHLRLLALLAELVGSLDGEQHCKRLF